MHVLIQNVAAIDCNFTFVENDSTGSASKVAQTLIANLDESQNHVFNCDQGLDGDFDFSLANDSTVGNRFNSQESFELQEPSCITSRRFITPRALNNVYNQLVVLNSATYVQKIQITECRYGIILFTPLDKITFFNYFRTVREACNDQSYPARNYKYICWQEYLTIKLSALRYGGLIYDEDFYYPSHCSCRLVRLTRRARNVNKPEIFYI